jgi:hypothetical protein
MRALAVLLALAVALTVLPLYAISLYNHPYYDDYGFSATVRAAWVQTRSPAQALKAAWDTSVWVRNTWQGNYTGTLLSSLQPGIFSESLYFLTTVFLLTAFLLCFWFLLHTVFRRVLGAGRDETAVAVSLFLLLGTQLMPDAGEAFYWFNGGVGNVFVYSLLALAGGLLARLWLTRRSGAWLAAGLFFVTFLLGGGSFGGGLLGILLYAAVTVFAFVRRHRMRAVFAALALFFAACFLYSVAAPGNAMRAAMLGVQGSAPLAVLKALYYGVALMGDFFTLPVFAALLLLAPILYRVAKASPYTFRHPLPLLAFGALLFCAQLTPPLYVGAGVFLGGGRAMNTYYVSYLVLLFFMETYAMGALARRCETRGLAPTPALRRGLSLAALCLLLVGFLGYKQPDDVLYGPMNMAGGSAALSILTGEAARYDREMDAREALLNDTAQPEVALAPLSVVPRVFMGDLLTPDALYDVRPALCRYYGKTAITIAEGGVR